MIVISPGHWQIGTGARGYIDEVTEARKVVAEVSKRWTENNIKHHVVIDQQSKNVQQNLSYLIREHQKYPQARHISVHFNSVSGTSERAIGCEVLFAHQQMKNLAERTSYAIHQASGLRNRGAKQRTNLRWLNAFAKTGILIEVCFVNSKADVELYQKSFYLICKAIAKTVIE